MTDLRPLTNLVLEIRAMKWAARNTVLVCLLPIGWLLAAGGPMAIGVLAEPPRVQQAPQRLDPSLPPADQEPAPSDPSPPFNPEPHNSEPHNSEPSDRAPSDPNPVALNPVALNVVFAHDPGRGRYDGVVGQADDFWNFVDVGTRQVAGLRSADGSRTAVSLKVSENDGEWGIQGQSGIFHGYIYHNCRCVDLRATVCCLPPGRYRIYVFAHGDAPDQNASIELFAGGETFGKKATLNDGSWRFRSTRWAEGVHYVSFEFDVFGREPVRITSRRSGSSYAMLNAIQIVPIAGR